MMNTKKIDSRFIVAKPVSPLDCASNCMALDCRRGNFNKLWQRRACHFVQFRTFWERSFKGWSAGKGQKKHTTYHRPWVSRVRETKIKPWWRHTLRNEGCGSDRFEDIVHVYLEFDFLAILIPLVTVPQILPEDRGGSCSKYVKKYMCRFQIFLRDIHQLGQGWSHSTQPGGFLTDVWRKRWLFSPPCCIGPGLAGVAHRTRHNYRTGAQSSSVHPLLLCPLFCFASLTEPGKILGRVRGRARSSWAGSLVGVWCSQKLLNKITHIKNRYRKLASLQCFK